MKEPFNIMMKRLPDFDSINFDSDWRWQVLDKLYSENYVKYIDKKDKPKIPKRIHQIWLGSKFPSRYQFWADSWKKLNPGYEYRLWTEADVDEILLDRKTYDSLTNYGPKSDLLRYHILNKFGGIYIDTDFECLRSFDDLAYLEFYTGVGYPSNIELYPGLIACTVSNPIIGKVVKEINKVEESEVKRRGALVTTSSYFFTNIFFEVIKEYQKGVVAFPPDYFYPFPNHKDHFNDIGRRYIKDCSYALHHWEVSWCKKGENLDLIEGSKFVKIVDFVYAPVNKAEDDYVKYSNTFNPAELNDINIVYTNVMYIPKLFNILQYLPQKFVVLSHNGDEHPEKGAMGRYIAGKKIREDKYPYPLPENILKWYSTNVDFEDDRVEVLPLGLENSTWKRSIPKRKIIVELMQRFVRKRGLAYLCFALNTNPDERTMVFNMFKDKPWVTAQEKADPSEFYKNIAEHSFVFNPQGNCFDNHRMWEAWLLGSIPISKRSICLSFFDDMPMVLVDDWNEVTEEFLNSEYERISKLDWNKEKLTFAYWKNKVLTL